MIADIRKKLEELADQERAKKLKSFFKTGPGEYGEGDVFIGVPVPMLRKLAKQCQKATLQQVRSLLCSPVHEQRQMALFILLLLYKNGDKGKRTRIYRMYLDNTKFVNNWDLVDCSAEHIVGAFLFDSAPEPLFRLARSRDLWERRIAIIATFYFIKHNRFDETFEISTMLLKDKHDLIHKAVGWMLREIGKRDLPSEEIFLREHYEKMPRTMLRYAIEKFPEQKRQRYLKGKVR